MANPAPQRKDLIYLALNFLTEQFNKWYAANLGNSLGEPVMKLTPVVNQKGDIQLGKLGMTLVDIEEDSVGKKQNPYRPKGPKPQDGYVLMNPSIKLNVNILVTAYGDGNYQEALKLISYAALNFQSRYVYSGTDYPEIAPIDTLILNLLNQDYRQSENLWTRIGAKYMPSILYRMKLLVIDAQQPIANITAGASQEVTLKKGK